METRQYELTLDSREVTLESFVEALVALQASIADAASLTSSILSPDQVLISELATGSATAQVSVPFPDAVIAEQFTQTMDSIADFAVAPTTDPVPRELAKSVKLIRQLVEKQHDNDIIWRTPARDLVLRPSGDSAVLSGKLSQSMVKALQGKSAYGSIRGDLQSLSGHVGLKVTVYDSVTGKGVKCSLPEEMRETLGGLWDKRVEVVGFIRRDSVDGRPLSMTGVRSIRAIMEPADSRAWEKARGVLKHKWSNKTSEELVRAIWDD